MSAPAIRLALALALVAAPAALSAKPPPPEPAGHPDWSEVAETGIELLTRSLYDPGSAQIEWRSGFQWGSLKPVIGKREFGWVACGNVNAKNRMGGYAGLNGFSLFVNEAGTVEVWMQNTIFSTCDARKHVPINPELLAVLNGPAPEIAVVGVADELRKLAGLRDDGIITAEEFDQQKAKLLEHR